MRLRLTNTARVAMLTASFAALGAATTIGAGSAFAGQGGPGQTTSGKDSLLGGNQVNAPISVPINICGNAIAILGTASATCEGGASVENHGGGSQHTVGGNQVNAPVGVPINLCGNDIGGSKADCVGGASVTNKGGGRQTTSGKNSLLGGNQVQAPITAPVNACGNAVAALDGKAFAHCEGVIPPVGDDCPDQGYYGSPAPPGKLGVTKGFIPSLPRTQVIPDSAIVSDSSYLPGKSRLPSAPGLPKLPGVSGLPMLPGLPGVPGLPNLPKVPGMPNLPKVPGLPVKVPGLPVDSAGLPADTPLTQSATPMRYDLPPIRQAGPVSLPGLPSVPDIGRLPGVSDAIGKLPISANIKPPQVGDLGDLGGQGVLNGLPLNNASASSRLQRSMDSNAIVALVLGGMFAATSAVTLVARRLRRR